MAWGRRLFKGIPFSLLIPIKTIDKANYALFTNKIPIMALPEPDPPALPGWIINRGTGISWL
jgi:hypothetical protein